MDGTDKVESLLNTDNMSSNMLSFFRQSSKLQILHIDSDDFFPKCKGWKSKTTAEIA